VIERYIALYLATLIVIAALDALWLGVIARDFFKSRLDDMLDDLTSCRL
jgi:uncharacterized membrane protein